MKNAFTLLELLVVIGILALLVGLGVPVFTSQMAKAKSAACLSNLRNIGIGLQSYLAENNATFPTLVAARASRDQTEQPSIDTVFLPYVENEKTFRCPAEEQLFLETGTSYYWNSALNGQAAASLNLFGLISDLSRIPILVDKEGWHRHTENRVNHLFADGHASAELRLFTE